jgi:hypothetical protein
MQLQKAAVNVPKESNHWIKRNAVGIYTYAANKEEMSLNKGTNGDILFENYLKLFEWKQYFVMTADSFMQIIYLRYYYFAFPYKQWSAYV